MSKNHSDTKGYELRIVDYAQDVTKAISLPDDDLMDLEGENPAFNLLCQSYSEILYKELEQPDFGSYVWLPQLYKLPMDQSRESFDVEQDVHLIENYSKKILNKSDDPNFGDTVSYDQSDFWRVVLIRTGEKNQYDNKSDLELLRSQIDKASQVFELPTDHFSAAIKWVKLGEVENIIENKELLPK